jgi:hypothetical protein
MSSDEFTPPRDDAAWKAAKKRVAERNEAAYARARQERAAHDEAVRKRQLAAERREFANLPTQPDRAEE